MLLHATIDHYLLEKARVTTQDVGEQGYHATYYLLAASRAQQPGVAALQLGADRYEALLAAHVTRHTSLRTWRRPVAGTTTCVSRIPLTPRTTPKWPKVII